MLQSKNIAGTLGKGIDRAVELGSLIGGFMLLVMALIIAYEVFARFFFNAPTNWTLDLSIHLLIWFCYASMASVQRQNRHVYVDLLISRFSSRTRAIWDIMTKFLFLVFILLLGYYVTKYAYYSFIDKEYSWATWQVLLWPVKAAMPLGTILLGLYLIKDIISNLKFTPNPSLEDRRPGLINKPFILIPLFLALIAVCVFLYTINGALGMVSLMFVLLFGGIPIFPALGLVGVVGHYFFFAGGSALDASIPTVSYNCLENFALVCLPLYILVGQALSSSGVGEELFDVATKWVGHFPGGEAVATVVACSIFAAISASSIATATTIGLIALPALAARKYNKTFSYGLLAAGGTLGIMIPPSGTFIIYSAVTEESLGKLFLAGVIPGILLASLFIGYSIYFCVKSGEYKRLKPATWQERFISTRRAVWGLLAPVIILGGIYTGIFTALESGAIAVIYSLIMVIVRGKAKPKEIGRVLAESTYSSTMIFSIIIGAMIMGDYMTLMKIPDKILEFVASLQMPPWGVMAALMFLYIIMGMFLEVVSIMMITLPIVYPLIIQLGFNGIWFGVMMTLNMEMAQITPPVGMNLYVISGITGASPTTVARGIVPFFFIMVVWMFFLALFPSLSTWLPNLMISR